MKKMYKAPAIDIVRFSSDDETNTKILLSGVFAAKNNIVEIPDGVGVNSAGNVLDF